MAALRSRGYRFSIFLVRTSGNLASGCQPHKCHRSHGMASRECFESGRFLVQSTLVMAQGQKYSRQGDKAGCDVKLPLVRCQQGCAYIIRARALPKSSGWEAIFHHLATASCHGWPCDPLWLSRGRLRGFLAQSSRNGPQDQHQPAAKFHCKLQMFLAAVR